MIKNRNFVRNEKSCCEPNQGSPECGYVLGSHIRKGLYEPVNPELSGLMRNVYDEPDCKDVDPLCSYTMDKFEKAVYARTKPEVAPSVPEKNDVE